MIFAKQIIMVLVFTSIVLGNPIAYKSEMHYDERESGALFSSTLNDNKTAASKASESSSLSSSQSSPSNLESPEMLAYRNRGISGAIPGGIYQDDLVDKLFRSDHGLYNSYRSSRGHGSSGNRHPSGSHDQFGSYKSSNSHSSSSTSESIGSHEQENAEWGFASSAGSHGPPGSSESSEDHGSSGSERSSGGYFDSQSESHFSSGSHVSSDRLGSSSGLGSYKANGASGHTFSRGDRDGHEGHKSPTSDWYGKYKWRY